MREKIKIIKSEVINNQLLLEVHEDVLLNELKATGQMLVDSDHSSFVYLAEKDDDYTYIVLDEMSWSNMKIALENVLPVLLKNGNGQLELFGFCDELSYLISNIKGNSNYGEEMAGKVEVAF